LNASRRPDFAVEKTLEVPAEIYALKASPETRTRAAEIQLRNREAFLKAFADGLAVLGYERDARGNGKFLLGCWDENWSYGVAHTGES
jgi:hypothetical protein